MPSVVLIGSVALDNVTTPAGERENALGGSATFSSYAANLFAPTGIVAVVGSDFPAEHIEAFRQRDIDISGLAIEDGPTFRWTGVYDGDMAQAKTLDTQLGVFADFKPVVPASFLDAPFVFLGNIHPDLQMDVLDQLANPKLVALDTMNYWIDSMPARLKQVIERVDLLFLNDAEARALTGQHNLFRAAHELIANGPEIVVIKRGEHGASVYTQRETILAPALPLKRFKDPTGAGDTFAGGMIGYLAAHGTLEADTLRNAALVGSVMASFTVEEFSVDGLARATRDDVQRRYDYLRKMVAFGPLC